MADIYKKFKADFGKLSQEGNIFHAYLFFGEAIDEIFDFSKQMASFLETGDFNKKDGFLNDFIVISPNEFNNIGIDEVRGLQKFLYQAPVISKKRTAIIYGADTLTGDSQGALLKMVEEPPQKSLVILIARQEDSLLPTIVSRVHKIYFPASAVFLKTKDKLEEELTKENFDKFFKNTIIDLNKDLRQNFDAAKEVLSRLMLVKKYNLNNRLQLRLLNFYLKKKQSFKKPTYGRKTKRSA